MKELKKIINHVIDSDNEKCGCEYCVSMEMGTFLDGLLKAFTIISKK